MSPGELEPENMHMLAAQIPVSVFFELPAKERRSHVEVVRMKDAGVNGQPSSPLDCAHVLNLSRAQFLKCETKLKK